MMALAFGPGRLVLICGTVVVSVLMAVLFAWCLLPLPACSARVVLQQNAAIRQVVPDAIGGGEITPHARGLPLLDQTLDLVNRHGWLRVFRLAQAHDPEHLVEVVHGLPD